MKRRWHRVKKEKREEIRKKEEMKQARKVVATYGYGFNEEAIVDALGGSVIEANGKPLDGTFDLLLLQGGADISPEIYGAKNEGKCQTANVKRDAVELNLISDALRRRVPIFGICRGHQMIAAALGGTLHQDLPNHRIGTHPLAWCRGKNLAGHKVNSLHHQAIDKVPSGFEVMARADDGTIEAIFSDRLHALGVQWHPEILAESDKAWLAVFQWWYSGFDGLAPIRTVKWWNRFHHFFMPEIWNDYPKGYGKGVRMIPSPKTTDSNVGPHPHNVVGMRNKVGGDVL